MNSRVAFAIIVLTLALASCRDDNSKPLDGGLPLDFERNPEAEAIMAKDPCWRREKGGWHLSVGHCEEMGPSEQMTGVWVTAFEETSFFPARASIPEPNDPLRFSQEIELDADAARKLARTSAASPNGEAFLLSFTGRRTRAPYLVDCQGIPSFSVVVDRLTSADYLGPMGAFDRRKLMNEPVTVTVRHKGRLGELEAEAVERCEKGPRQP